MTTHRNWLPPALAMLAAAVMGPLAGSVSGQNGSAQNVVGAEAVRQGADRSLNGTGGRASPSLKVRAVYLSGATAGKQAALDYIIGLAGRTELNGVVIDAKDGFGKVNYASEVPEVKESGAVQVLYDADAVIRRLHAIGMYVIARVVCFRDPWLANKRADLAIRQQDGGVWRENGTTPWANPYNREVWNYNISIAKEAADKGFDEIQFDYVRFPSGRSTNIDWGADPPEKTTAIEGFLAAAAKALSAGKGAKISADVFGIVCDTPGDYQKIGQDIGTLGCDIDYVCPMVYPSHFANASHGKGGNGVGQIINGVLFAAPDLQPYEVVYNTLARCKSRISAVVGYRARVRPYLQAFTAWTSKDDIYFQTYGPEQIRLEIQAVYDAGYDEWILWDSGSRYAEAIFEKRKAE